jgi:AcrR family transcriptional regulator
MIERKTRTPSVRIGADVLDAALTLLGEEGPDHFTVRAIAARAEVAPMALYNHFDGKNGVLEAIWIDGFEQLRDCIGVGRGLPLDDLHQVGIDYRQFALAHRAHYTVMFMHRFVGFEPSLEASHAAARAFGALVNQVERAKDAGHFLHLRASDAAQMLWATSHGYVSLEILDVNFAHNAKATYEDLISGLLRGLK